MESSFNLRDYDIKVAVIHHNLPPCGVYEHVNNFKEYESGADVWAASPAM